MKMSKENDEYFRRGAVYGFRAGYYSALHEMQNAMGSAEAYDRNEKKSYPRNLSYERHTVYAPANLQVLYA